MGGGERLGRIVNAREEGLIAFLFAAMTLVTFSQVVSRYVFNAGAVWALELTTYLFAWMVLIGISYGVKVNAHLGVDAFVRLFNSRVQRIFALIAVVAGLAYAGILFIGSWEYVGKLYKIGIEAEDLKISRWIPMMALPIGLSLLFIRIAQAGWMIVTGRKTGLMIGDEAQDAIRQHLDQMKDEASSGGDGEPPK
jgi:C4-dicarboxylate transporter, DctQ subunit